jgi:hypothetical protein
MALNYQVDCISVAYPLRVVGGFKQKNYYWFDKKVMNKPLGESKNTF